MENYNFSVEDIRELKSMINELCFYLQKDIMELKSNKSSETFIDDKKLDLHNAKSMYNFLKNLL